MEKIKISEESGGLEGKIKILEKNGFKYLFDRDLFYNPNSRKCFSLEYVADNTTTVITKKIGEPPRKLGISYYFNNPPLSKEEQEALDNELKAFLSRRNKPAHK